ETLRAAHVEHASRLDFAHDVIGDRAEEREPFRMLPVIGHRPRTVAFEVVTIVLFTAARSVRHCVVPATLLAMNATTAMSGTDMRVSVAWVIVGTSTSVEGGNSSQGNFVIAGGCSSGNRRTCWSPVTVSISGSCRRSAR